MLSGIVLGIVGGYLSGAKFGGGGVGGTCPVPSLGAGTCANPGGWYPNIQGYPPGLALNSYHPPPPPHTHTHQKIWRRTRRQGRGRYASCGHAGGLSCS